MRIGCLLSVREKATRLPKKVLLDIAGEPLARRLLQRLSMAEEIDELIVSTSVHPDDQVLVDLASDTGFKSFQGSEEDKLDRYYQTALAYDLDAVIVVDGDDLLCFPEGVDLVAKRLRVGDCDCVAIPGLPLGAASTGLTTESLKRIMSLKDEEDTEVWGAYFFGSGYFNSVEVEAPNPLWLHPDIRLTLDYEDDYALLKMIMDEFEGRIDFSSDELMELLVKGKPELQKINARAQQKYQAHLSKSAPVKFKDQTPGAAS